MAAVTAGVVTAGAAAASAASSIKQGKQADKNAKKARKAAEANRFTQFGAQGPGGLFANFANGNLNVGLGDRLGGQQSIFDAIGQGAFQDFLAGPNVPRAAIDAANARANVAGLQPEVNTGLFDQLGGAFGNQFGAAAGDIAAARSAVPQGLTQGLFGQAMTQFGDIGTGAEVAADRLGLLREQAAPFEQRAFNNLQENLFSTGRLGSSGGALQTEAFARGLGQADLDRQLQASAEGRRHQQNALNLGNQMFSAGRSGLNLTDQLVGNASNRFNMFGSALSDFDNTRFRQQTFGQGNLFNQLGQVGEDAIGLDNFAFGREQDFFNRLGAAFAGGNALNNMPLDFLRAAQSGATAVSNSGMGTPGAIANNPGGNTSGAMASLFGGLAQAGRSGSLQTGLEGIGNFFRGNDAIAPPGTSSGNQAAGNALNQLFPET